MDQRSESTSGASGNTGGVAGMQQGRASLNEDSGAWNRRTALDYASRLGSPDVTKLIEAAKIIEKCLAGKE